MIIQHDRWVYLENAGLVKHERNQSIQCISTN